MLLKDSGNVYCKNLEKMLFGGCILIFVIGKKIEDSLENQKKISKERTEKY